MSRLRWAAAFLGAVAMTTASAATTAAAYAGSSDSSGLAQRLCALEKRVDRRLGKLEAGVEALEAPSPEVEAGPSAPPKCRRVAPHVVGRRVHSLERRTERRVATLEARVQALEQNTGLPAVPGGQPRIARPGATVPQGSPAIARRAKGFERSFRKRLNSLTQRVASLENYLPVSTSDLPPEPPSPAPEPPPPAPEPPPPAPEPPPPSPGPGPTTGAQSVRDNAGPRGPVSRPSGAIEIHPGDNIQKMLDAGGPNAKFWFRAGTHRITTSIRPKDGQNLSFESQAVLKGSKLVTNWTPEGANFVSTGHTQSFSLDTTTFKTDDNPAAGVYEDLFMDGKPLTHVLSLGALGPGKVYFDKGADKMYVRNNPSGHRMEATIATNGIIGSANGVIVRGAIIEHFGHRGLNETGDDWIIEDNEIRYCHSICLYLNTGSERTIVRHNYIHHGGANAIGAFNGDGHLFEANEISHGNYLGFGDRPGPHQESGVKALRQRNCTVWANWSHDNDGDGWWFDSNQINTLIEENVFEDNTRWGFFYEASYGATVRNNLFANNGVGGPFGGWGFERGGIMISTSKDVDINNNVLDLNHSFSLRYRWDNRGSGMFGSFELVNNNFHHNEIRFNSVASGGTRAEIVSIRDANKTAAELASNTFDNNVYKTNNLTKTWWFWPSGKLRTFSQWQSLLGHDHNGSHLKLT